MSSSITLPHDWFPKPLPNNVQIGPQSWLYSSFAFLHYHSRRPIGVRIGHDTGVYNGTFFDLGVDGEVYIGDYCTLVGAILATNGRVAIGDYTFIAHEVTIADHFAATPPGGASHATRMPSADISIGSNVWIGARAILLPGAEIGDGAVVGAASVVNTKVPPNSVVAGNPARICASAASPRSGPESSVVSHAVIETGDTQGVRNHNN
jgi:acetyltransferase-like isoleucine patch superfamily enzyme